jgi:hypothetical protein
MANPALAPRLAPAAHEVPDALGGPAAESSNLPEVEDLETELARYFTLRGSGHSLPDGALEQLRQRVVDGVAERIMRQWERGGESAAFQTAFENGVLERLIQRMFERLTAAKDSRKASAASASGAA